MVLFRQPTKPEFHINNYVIKLTNVINIRRPTFKKGLSFHVLYTLRKDLSTLHYCIIKNPLERIWASDPDSSRSTAACFILVKEKLKIRSLHTFLYPSQPNKKTAICVIWLIQLLTYKSTNNWFVYNFSTLFHLLIEHSRGFTCIEKHTLNISEDSQKLT